jgi:LuxR family maltose regulon positive regulatory protein
LDVNDNDPNRFVDYLIGAYSYLRIPILQKLLNDNQYLFKGNTQAQVEVLLNCIFDSGENITMVMDDFQNIHSSTIINLMNYFIENLPENAPVILLTRSDPP